MCGVGADGFLIDYKKPLIIHWIIALSLRKERTFILTVSKLIRRFHVKRKLLISEKSTKKHALINIH